MSNEANQKKMAIWRHNSFFGHVRMAWANMNGIANSVTATPEAKETANQILDLLDKLKGQLRTRNPGT